jgi:hypothetical protein
LIKPDAAPAAQHPAFQRFHAAGQLRRRVLADLHVLLEGGEQGGAVRVIEQDRGQCGLQHLHLRGERQLVFHQAVDVLAVQFHGLLQFFRIHGASLFVQQL